MILIIVMPMQLVSTTQEALNASVILDTLGMEQWVNVKVTESMSYNTSRCTKVVD